MGTILGTVLTMTVLQDLRLWFQRYRNLEKPIPSIESKLEKWFKKQEKDLADTFKAIGKKEPRISTEEIFEILVNLKLFEFYLEEFSHVSLKKFDITLNRAWKGLLYLWLFEFVDSEGVALNNRRLSWPELAGYLMNAKKLVPYPLPIRAEKRSGPRSKAVKNLMLYLVWNSINSATKKQYYDFVIDVYLAAGFSGKRENLKKQIYRLKTKPDPESDITTT